MIIIVLIKFKFFITSTRVKLRGKALKNDSEIPEISNLNLQYNPIDIYERNNGIFFQMLSEQDIHKSYA